MKKSLLTLIMAAAALSIQSCSHEDNDIKLSDYDEWRAENDQWLKEIQNRKNPDGSPYYRTLIPVWNPGAFVLIHYFNDRLETAGNLSPLYTSTVDVRYIGYNKNNEPFDSSTTINTTGTPGVARFRCNNVIQGWSIAMEDMRVGDTAEVVVPYNVGYGSSYSAAIKPYSNLRFNIRLVDIYRYEAAPY
ncbi:MAG: FKBP-type peptidyl-prolyl cis-trans isomerase [Muribaculaceae bacterium]|nr:FKBP-type peptidyl-prolyl cis-trans isomerase [Muribaculaceae bacterium]